MLCTNFISIILPLTVFGTGPNVLSNLRSITKNAIQGPRQSISRPAYPINTQTGIYNLFSLTITEGLAAGD